MNVTATNIAVDDFHATLASEHPEKERRWNCFEWRQTKALDSSTYYKLICNCVQILVIDKSMLISYSC